MTCGHLFNGIGGFALAAHWMRWENIMHCEIDKFCNRVMKHHFPNSIQHEDIRTTDFSIYRGKLDIVTGGFPCQPYSTAGKRKGKQDERHLWPEMLRAIRQIQPRWVVGENVRGLTNWNGGLVFDEVQADLEAEGYEVLPFLLPAAGVNAPHRRDRVWFVAFNSKCTADGRNNPGTCTGNGMDMEKRVILSGGREQSTDNIESSVINATNATGIRCNRVIPETERLQWQEQSFRETGQRHTSKDGGQWRDFPTQSPLRSGDDGIPIELDGITLSSWGEESIKAAGNAIVPQVAYQLFKAIQQYENL